MQIMLSAPGNSREQASATPQSAIKKVVTSIARVKHAGKMHSTGVLLDADTRARLFASLRLERLG